MKLKKILCVIISAVLICSVFSACSKRYLDNYVYFDIKNKPHSIDPQTAKTDEELLIVRNIFEGLLRKNEKGKIVCGAAKSYKKSGLTYTFKLRKDAVWSDKTPVTAYDFVFGIRRAVSPAVKCPYGKRLSKIVNAEAALNGTASPEAIGVTANDEETLQITLSSEDKSFEDTLTTSVAMPCNEEFFNSTSGKYGLDAESILSNGSYVLKKWNADDFAIRLYRNEEYSGSFKAQNGAVFISSKEDETPDVFFDKKSVDCAFVESENLDDVLKLKVNKISYQNICWVMTVSDKYSPQIRTALLSSFSADVYKDNLPSGFKTAQSLYPAVLSVDSSINGAGYLPYDLENAKSVFSSVVAKEDDKAFPSASLYTYDSSPILPVARAILGHWQNNLCAFINISGAKFPEELVSELNEKKLDFALFPVIAKSSDLNEYLLNFGISGYDAASAQNALLSARTLIPVAFEDTNICYTEQLTLPFTECENGYIDFAFAVKK